MRRRSPMVIVKEPGQALTHVFLVAVAGQHGLLEQLLLDVLWQPAPDVDHRLALAPTRPGRAIPRPDRSPSALPLLMRPVMSARRAPTRRNFDSLTTRPHARSSHPGPATPQ